MKVSSLKARIRTIRNSNIPTSDRRYLIDKLRQIIEANRQLSKIA